MKVLIVYYSMYGHVLRMARAVEEGAKTVEGVDVVLRRAEEFDDVKKQIEADEHAPRSGNSKRTSPSAPSTTSEGLMA